MDGSQGNNNSAAPAPFLTKTYEMVDDPSTNTIVSWSHNGYSFVVWNPPEFAQELLPKYFKHNNFSSFVRQLNTYGFRKVDPDQWEFANAEFIRGQRQLLKHIHRRKPIHSHSLQSQVHLPPLSESEKKQFKDEIMRLKNDKCLLQQELQRHEMDKQHYQFQILTIGQRVERMEYKQIQMMTCLAQLMKKPQFSSILMKLTEEYYSKKKRLLKFDNFNGDCKMEGNQNLPLTTGNLQEEAYIAPVLDEELVDKLDSSLNCWENFIYRVEDSLTQQEGHGHGYGIISQPSSVTVRELSPFSDDGEPSSPGSLPSPPCSKDVPSSPEVAGCFNHVDTPMTSCCPENHMSSQCSVFEANVCSKDVPSSPEVAGCFNHVDTPMTSCCRENHMSSQCSVFEANVEPASIPAPSVVNGCSNDSALEANNPSAPAGENDCFWENFLSEAPVFI